MTWNRRGRTMIPANFTRRECSALYLFVPLSGTRGKRCAVGASSICSASLKLKIKREGRVGTRTRTPSRWVTRTFSRAFAEKGGPNRNNVDTVDIFRFR
jgi:hypothetical protein